MVESSISVTLPDGKILDFDQSVTVAKVAESIGPGLAKAALAGLLDEDNLVDASHVIDKSCSLSIITAGSAEGVEVIRHSTAHLLAQSVKQLFPKAQVTIGPVIKDGFYYDFKTEVPFTEEDLSTIEKRMYKLAKQDQQITRSVMARDEAIKYFKNIGEDFKAEIIGDLPVGEEISAYTQTDFTDLCRGPHVPNTKFLKAFKLTKISSAYWRGDSQGESLQRIYGTAWSNKDELAAYLERLRQAALRDHRVLGKKMQLWHFDEVAPGMVFWRPRGWQLYKNIKEYVQNYYHQHGYQEISTPQLVGIELWQESGHWDKFRDNMFVAELDNRNYAVKPMNCPCHVKVYNATLHSYRDLPIRLAELGSCHRNEPSGTLHGLMRLRNFVQDDAHIFCTIEQIAPEVKDFIQQLTKVYSDFGFSKFKVALSTRPVERVGDDQVWDRAEGALTQVLDSMEVAWQLQPGEGAFYGPKIEFVLEDCLERHWQCGTIQLDFSMPERLGAKYIDKDNNKQTPVMLHRAILGSLERFIAILLENTAGHLPFWLAPVQLKVLGISDKQEARVIEITNILQENGFLAESDLRQEKIGYKIREHAIARVPLIIVIGAKELENGTVAVRDAQGKDLGEMDVDKLLAFIESLHKGEAELREEKSN